MLTRPVSCLTTGCSVDAVGARGQGAEAWEEQQGQRPWHRHHRAAWKQEGRHDQYRVTPARAVRYPWRVTAVVDDGLDSPDRSLASETLRLIDLLGL